MHSIKFTKEKDCIALLFVNKIRENSLKMRFVERVMVRIINWSYGVMVSTLDFESNNPSSILGRTFLFFFKN